MIRGPDNIYKCPTCSNLFARGSLLSGNTILVKGYSDGKKIYKMLPESPRLIKCTKCNHIFWISKEDKIGIRPRGSYGKWANVESCKFLSIYDYIRALDNKMYTSKEEELFICLRILWGFNDRVRKGESLFTIDIDIHHWEKNIYRLLYLIEYNKTSRFLIAELHRNLGDFEKCIEIINSIEDKRHWEKSKFIEHCKSQNKLVFELNYLLKAATMLINTEHIPFHVKKKRLSELAINEKELKKDRDFDKLLRVLREIMSLTDSNEIHSKLLPQTAYCCARIGNTNAAKEILYGFSRKTYVDEAQFITQNMIVSFFFDIKVNDINASQINVIQNWIQDPNISTQVKQTIFDYEDLINLES